MCPGQSWPEAVWKEARRKGQLVRKACSCLWVAGPELVLGRAALPPGAQEAAGDAVSQTALPFVLSLAVMTPCPPRLAAILVNKDDEPGSRPFCVEDRERLTEVPVGTGTMKSSCLADRIEGHLLGRVGLTSMFT